MTKLPIFYTPQQSCPNAASYSPSAGKPALAVADWLSNDKIAPRIEVQGFEPVSREVLYAVHDKAYVDAVLDGREENGFGNRHRGVAASLPYTVGSMVTAAKHVLSKPTVRGVLNAAVSPTSGFHHANYSHGGGFCTFNGLMAAAVEVHRLRLAKKILIVDFDQHYGDGTENIINKLGIDYVTHITAEKSYNTGVEAIAVSQLYASHRICATCRSLHYDLILYQAGADIHVDDPLGGRLTTAEMSQRDSNIFWSAKMARTPIVWCLAGGYRLGLNGTLEPVLALHRNTMLQCLSAYNKPEPMYD